MNIETPATGIGAADPLLPQAAAWVEGLRGQGEYILRQPVSRLQLQFRIGYSRACALVEALALDTYWRIEFTEDGRRFARLRPGGEE
jgi:DNA segregation ATPase FtsK/SpoIIIE-like protein